MRIILFQNILIALVFVTNSYAQRVEKEHINYANGLSNSQITTIRQDSLGYIWVGTQGGGVYRWDGTDLKPLHDSLKYEIVRDVLPTSSGTWVISVGKIFKVDKKKEIRSFSDAFNLEIEDETRSNDDFFIKIIPLENEQYVIQSLGGNLLLINSEGEILDKVNLGEWYLKSRKFQDSIVFYFRNLVLNVSVVKNKIVVDSLKEAAAIFADDEQLQMNKTHFLGGEFWIQKEDRIEVYNLDFELLKEINLPFSAHVFDISKWDKYIYLSTEEGLYRTIIKNGELKILSRDLSTQVYKVLNTKEGLWVGTLNGLFHLTIPKIYLLEEEIENEKINGYFAFEIINEKLWAGSHNSGIHIYDGENLIEEIKFENEGMNEVRSLIQDGDSLWMGTSVGLFKMHQSTHQFRKLDDIKSRVISIEKMDNSIAFGTAYGGVWVLEDGVAKSLKPINELRNKTVWTLKHINDQLLIGTETGLYALTEDSIMEIRINKIVQRASVTAIELIDDSTIAVGFAQYGVYIYDLQRKKVLHHYNDNNGLSSSYIYFLKLIKNKLWIGSSLGIDIADLEKPYATFQMQDLNKIGGAETFLNGIVHYDDKIIASTIAGTLVIPDNFLDIRQDVKRNFNPIIIEKAEPLSFSSVHDFLDLREKRGEPIKVPFGHGSIKFHFNVAHFGAEKLKFLYQLEGYDEEISEPSDEKFAIYKQLPAGNYTFKVWRSFNNQKVGDPATLALTITTPFYKTTWFRLALVAIMSALAILFLIIRARAKTARAVETIKIREQAQSDLRKEMAIDFHDEMGNHLAKIINLSGVLKMWGLQNEQEKVVSKIENAANSLFISTKDLIWSLRKENNNLEEVYFHSKDFAENLLDKADISFRTYKNGNGKDIILNPKAARDLSLIIKEALTNVYKHAKAKNVHMNFEISGHDHVKISISDDGCGCLDYEKKSGNGLKNMKQRALRSNFHFEQTASKDSGCEITISINTTKLKAHV